MSVNERPNSAESDALDRLARALCAADGKVSWTTHIPAAYRDQAVNLLAAGWSVTPPGSAESDAVYKHRGTAYGSDPNHHHIVDGDFVCSAPPDAKCRTFPTCECENWCCCETPNEDCPENEHCCMSTVKPGQKCWIKPWVDAVGVGDSHCEEHVRYDEDSGEPILTDGPVWCDWEDGICWAYATRVLTPAAHGFGLLRSASPDDDLTPITGGLDPDTEVVDTRDTTPEGTTHG